MCPYFHVQKNGTYSSIMIPYAKQTVILELLPPPQKSECAREEKNMKSSYYQDNNVTVRNNAGKW
jgi:hypothetical protein